MTAATADKSKKGPNGIYKTIRKGLVLMLKLAVSGGLLWFVLHKAGFQKVLQTIRGMDAWYFLAAAGLYILGTFVSCFRWRLFLSARLALKKFFSLYMLGSFFNTFLPGMIGGDAVKGYYVYKETGRMAESMASIFMDRYLGFTALMLIAFLAYPVGLPYLKGKGLAWLIPAIFAAFVFMSLLFFKLRLGGRIRLLADFYGYFGTYGKRALFKGLLVSLVVQSISNISVYVLARGFGMDVSLPLFFVFVPLITTFSSIPLSISGLGIREASFVLLFGSVGVSPQTATALSFALFLSTAAGSLPGLYEYLKIKKN